MVVQQGRNERRGETYALYVESLSDARTPLADILSILLEIRLFPQHRDRAIPVSTHVPHGAR